MDLSSCFRLGQILRPHGVKGEVVAFIETDNPEEYLELESVFVIINQRPVPFFIDDATLLKKGEMVIKFEDIDDIKDAQPLSGCDLYLPLEELPDLEDGGFYYHEIIDYEVHDEKLGVLGTITEIYERNPQDLLLMTYKGREVFIPVDDSICLNADHNKKVLFTNLPDGLVDLYLTDEHDED